jgi:hypothetical protein
MSFWDFLTRKEERARLKATYDQAIESVKSAATHPEVEQIHPAPEFSTCSITREGL